MAELRYKPWGETRYTYGSTPTTFQYTGQRKDATGLYFYNARYYDPALGRFLAADSIVPGAADGAGGGAATLGYDSRTRLTPLTVNLGEFAAQINEENREVLQFGPFFQWDSKTRQQHNVPMGPANPQSLNRYAYVLNNSLRYTDPTGHIIPILIPLATGVLGGLASAGGSLIVQVGQGGGSLAENIQGVDWGNVAIAGGVGFVAGALSPFVPSALGAIALAADANVVQYVLTQKSNNDPITNGGVIANLGTGMAAGWIAGPFNSQPRLLSEAGFSYTAREAAKINSDILLDCSVLTVENFGRSAASGIVSNVDGVKLITDAFHWVINGTGEK